MDWNKTQIPGKHIIYAFIAVAVVYTALSNPPNTQPAPNFESIGYFKSESKERIYTFAIDADAQTDAITAHGNGLMYTPRSMTAAYYYTQGTANIPADGLTLAENIFTANHLLYERPGISKWRYAYLKDRLGGTTLVDCIETPQHDLCRK